MIHNVNDVGVFVYSSFVKAREFNNHITMDAHRRTPQLTRRLLDMAGAPDRGSINILVTGSKGKGSLSIILHGILRSLGYKVGLFTGPHLVDFNERIRINSENIPDEDFIRIANDITSYVDNIQKDLRPCEYIGPVGILAVIASLYFKEHKTDFNIIECGKGARFDDVAQLTSEMSLINSVFLEHTEELGKTIEDIAYHKAGVINKGQRAVFLGRQTYGQVYDTVKKEASLYDIPVHAYGKDFSAQDISENLQSTTFSYENMDLEISLNGKHQAYNAVTAIAAVECLLGRKIDSSVLNTALMNIRWAGRLEILQDKPMVIVDGCINRMSAEYVVQYIRRTLVDGQNFLENIVLSIPDDKDYEGVIDAVSSLGAKIILTEANNPSLKYANKLQYKYAVNKLGMENTVAIEKSYDAISYGLSATSEKGMLCILGTISLLRDAILYFSSN